MPKGRDFPRLRHDRIVPEFLERNVMYLNLIPKKVFEIKHKNFYNIRENMNQ